MLISLTQQYLALSVSCICLLMQLGVGGGGCWVWVCFSKTAFLCLVQTGFKLQALQSSHPVLSSLANTTMPGTLFTISYISHCFRWHLSMVSCLQLIQTWHAGQTRKLWTSIYSHKAKSHICIVLRTKEPFFLV